MPLFNRLHSLLEMDELSSEAQSGHAFAVVTQNADTQAWAVFLDLELSGGGGSTSAQIVLETSHDGSTWVPVGNPVSLNASGEKSDLQTVATLGPLIRARTEIGGAPAPSHKATVKLASNEDFRVKKVAVVSSHDESPVVAVGPVPVPSEA